MIIESTDSIMQDDMDGDNVIVNPVNCKAVIQPGLSSQICRKIEGWYNDFRDYCSWFNKSTWNTSDHHDEILGSFHRFQVNEHLIVCSIFVQDAPSKDIHFIDFDSWSRVLKKIERQTVRAKQVTGKSWTLHLSNNACKQENEQGESVRSIVEEVFSQSPVDVVIHM